MKLNASKFLFDCFCFIYFYCRKLGQPNYVAALDAPIPEDNRGHIMLKKMGWGGQGIGKNEQGMAEPIGVRFFPYESMLSVSSFLIGSFF